MEKLNKFIFIVMFFLNVLNAYSQELKYISNQQYVGAGNNIGTSNVVDGAGNVYACGYFEGTVDFDANGGTENRISAGLEDIFITKTDPSGNLLWVAVIGGTGTDIATEIEIDGNSNLYLTGSFSNTVDFNPDTTLVQSQTAVGQTDIFVLKINSSGVYQWVSTMGGTSNERGQGIALDNGSNVIVTGQFAGTVDFNPGAATQNLVSAGNDDIFILKLNTSGAYTWAQRIGGTGNDAGLAIMNYYGYVLTTGYFSGSVDFDPDATNALMMSASGSRDVFISMLTSSGGIQSAKKIGGSGGASEGHALLMSYSGEVLLGGFFSGTVDMNPGSGTANQTSLGMQDGFIAHLVPGGSFFYWSKQIGSTGFDAVYDLRKDAVGNVYAAGEFTNTATFNIVPSTFNLVADGGKEAFVSLYSSSGTFLDAKKMGGTSNEVANSLAVTAAGVVYTTGYFSGTSNFNTDGGVDTFSTSSPTDTDFYLHKMKLCTPNYTPLNISACGPYTWSLNNTTYTTDGAYSVVLTNTLGCDSTVTLNLIIVTFDTTVSVNGTELIANQSGALTSYQWVDCNNGNTPIAGETNQNFTPTVNGNYAVEITINGCTKTSDCFNVVISNLNSISGHRAFNIYPNPAAAQLTIQTSEMIVNKKIIDLSGRVVYTENDDKTTVNVANLPTGIYFIKLSTDKGIYQQKFVKN